MVPLGNVIASLALNCWHKTKNQGMEMKQKERKRKELFNDKTSLTIKSRNI